MWAIIACMVVTAAGHGLMTVPTPRAGTSNAPSSGPCGTGVRATFQPKTATYKAGDDVEVSWRVDAAHGGTCRISLSTNGLPSPETSDGNKMDDSQPKVWALTDDFPCGSQAGTESKVVSIPDEAKGEGVLQWSWRNWNSCADVEIEGTAAEPTTMPPTTTPMPPTTTPMPAPEVPPWSPDVPTEPPFPGEFCPYKRSEPAADCKCVCKATGGGAKPDLPPDRAQRRRRGRKSGGAKPDLPPGKSGGRKGSKSRRRRRLRRKASVATIKSKISSLSREAKAGIATMSDQEVMALMQKEPDAANKRRWRLDSAA